MKMIKSGYLIPVLLAAICGGCGKKEAAVRLDPAPGSRIVFVGNSFAEKLQEYNYFEALLYRSFPDRELRVRNLAWSADEVNLRPRPLNFGSMDEHLQQQQADVLIAAFGMNESFKGPDSLENFGRDLEKLLSHWQGQAYNGKQAPQIVLLSPIAHENLGGLLPDPSAHNENLAAYTREMARIAGKLDIPFVDLFNPTLKLMDGPDSLTLNGIHLNETGYRKVSALLAGALNLPVQSWEGDPPTESLRKAIGRKNQHFFYRFRAQNGEYIYGRRREWAGGQALSEESRRIDGIVGRLDSVIWQGSAAGKSPDWEKLQEVIASPAEEKPAAQEEDRKALEAARASFVLEEGYEIELFASELDFPLANPVAITFDAQGRMWVATMPSYPHYTPGVPPNDQLIILEDSDHDGKADRHSVFADSLYLPLGFELGHGGVYLTQAPDLVFLKDTDGDGRADYRKTLLSGFGTEDSHHTLSAFTWGPDGALYMHMGTFLHSQIETPYGPRRGAYGTTWRYEPRSMKLDPYISYPYANPWGQVFTREGTHLIADVSTGMNYFGPPLTVAIDYPKKHMLMRDFLSSPSKPKTCGMEIISSRAFPDDAQGNVLFNTFIGFQGVRKHAVSEEGSGILAKELQPLLQSKDPNFRPVDLKFGPDGALYVVDWYDPIVQHGEQNFRDPLRDKTRGRIWRVTYKGKKTLPVADLSTMELPALFDQLKQYEDRARYRARVRIGEFPEAQVLPALEKWLEGLDPAGPEFDQLRLEALWVRQQFHRPEPELLEELLASGNAGVRAAAVRVLFYWAEQLEETPRRLAELARDPAPRVRLEAIIALSHFKTPESVRALLEAASLPVDDYIGYALIESFKHLRPVWLEMFRKDPDFLAGEAGKAGTFLFGPLLAKEQLQVPGFITDDPAYRKYGVEPLTEQEIEVLAAAPAFRQFREARPELFQAQAAPAAPAPAAEEEGPRGEVVLELAALPGKMRFDKERLRVPAGKTVSLIFDNRDQMPHNVVITKPGAEEKVGTAADNMAAEEDAYARNFVPAMSEVLFASPLVNAGTRFRLDFKAPEAEGEYPFLCTFPGHWRMMQGILEVVKE